MKDCIFCKIVSGELPADIIYENEKVIAFFDISPINKGHTLVIPKEHHGSLSSIPAEIQMSLLNVSGRIGKALVRGCDFDGYNLHMSNGECAGQAVPHAHMHIVPRVGTDGFHWNWRSLTYENDEKAELKSKLLSKLTIDES
jgi:histidine triad (HIT) family protein